MKMVMSGTVPGKDPEAGQESGGEMHIDWNKDVFLYSYNVVWQQCLACFFLH